MRLGCDGYQIIGGVPRVSAGHSVAAQRHYDRAAAIIRRIKAQHAPTEPPPHAA